MSVPFMNLWVKDATEGRKHQVLALYTEKDFAIGKISRKTKLWISLCIFLIQVNNSFIKVILKTYLYNKIKALL